MENADAGRQRTVRVPPVPLGVPPPGQAGRAALVAGIVRAVAEALSAPDADLARERAEVVAELAAQAAGAFGSPTALERRRQSVAGLLSGFAAHSRPFGRGTQP